MFTCRTRIKMDQSGHVGSIWYQNRVVQVPSWSKYNDSKWPKHDDFDTNIILKEFASGLLYCACIFTFRTHEKRGNSPPKLMLLQANKLTWTFTRFCDLCTRTCDIIAICVDGIPHNFFSWVTEVALSFTVCILLGDASCQESFYIKNIRRPQSPRVAHDRRRWATLVTLSTLKVNRFC